MSQISFDPVDSALRAGTSGGFSSLRSEDFIKIIFTELANQDPFQPNDSSALLEQMSSIRKIESDLQLTQRLDALVFQNQLASAAGLIGKQVYGLSAGNDQVTGTVSAVLRQGDAVFLELDSGLLLPIDNVAAINQQSPAP